MCKHPDAYPAAASPTVGKATNRAFARNFLGNQKLLAQAQPDKMPTQIPKFNQSRTLRQIRGDSF